MEHSASSKWRRHFLAAAVALLSSGMTSSTSSLANAFSLSPPITIGATSKSCRSPLIPFTSRLYAETTQSASSSDNDTTLPSPSDMRLREIQSELKEGNISYADCFDRESLVKRLVEARDGLVQPQPSFSPPKNEGGCSCCSETTEAEATPPPAAEATQKETTSAAEAEPSTESDASSLEEEFDRDSTLIELRSLRVRELKEKLSEVKVRWGTMIEKEEMVQALCKAMEERFELSKNFSRSGELIPGTVADVEESVLIKELGWSESDLNRGIITQADGESSTDLHSPVLLDAYATWCGPCQLMAPFLKDASEVLGPSVRVVKLDTDKYPRISSALKIGGLPTLIRFDGGGVSKEIQRVEGALTKDQIIDFVNGNFNR